MQPIRTLLVDDEPLARQGLRQLLSDDDHIQLVGEAEHGGMALDFIRSLEPDLVFLDIEMPPPNGIEVAQQLGLDGPLVVFVTAFDQYAVDAFEAEAVDYVLKPFDDARFRQTLERAKRRVRQRRIDHHRSQLVGLLGDDLEAGLGALPPGSQDPSGPVSAPTPKRLILRSAGRIRIVDLDDVRWVGGSGNYVELHHAQGSDLYRQSLHHMEGMLDAQRYLRIHRSTIVRLDCVRDLKPLDRGDYLVVLDDGTELKMSRTYRDRLPILLQLPPSVPSDAGSKNQN